MGGSTENGAVATALLSDLVDRGLDTGQGVLCVLDGSKAVRSVLGEVPVQWCIRHKERNVLEQRRVLARELDRTHAGAAASLREGLEEALTLTRLRITGSLKRTLESTYPCASMIECVRRKPAATSGTG